jgi:hypothetical protein
MPGVETMNDCELLRAAALLFEDLDIMHYPGKWNQARRLMLARSPRLTGKPYWRAVRQTFLELGGGRRKEY